LRSGTAAHEPDGVLGVDLAGVTRVLRPIEAGAAMDELGRFELAVEWGGAAGMNLDLEAEQLSHYQGISGGEFQWDVPSYGRDALKLTGRPRKCDRQGVVMAGIAVENDAGATCAHAPWSS
jgi:hypothetical protein